MTKVVHLEDKMRELALRAYPNEACGLIVAGRRGKTKLIGCENVAEDPKNTFIISHLQWSEIVDELGMEVVGVWHSHVDQPATPSDADRFACEATALPWFISAVWKNEVGVFTVTAPELLTPSGFTLPYEGRPYIFGLLDCYSLVREHMDREHNCEMGPFPQCRQPNWAMNGNSFLVENIENAGLVRLPANTKPQAGDIFFMQIGASVPDHIAVYLGNDLILHHQHGRLSCKAVYGGFWEKHTTHHLRHKDKC